MALYRAEVKPMSRSKGHNAVAAAAYRAGEELTDKNKYNPNAMTHDYSKKSDIMHKHIILPAALAEQGFTIARQDLWSMVEEHEVTKKDQTLKASARVAREWLLALPHELSDSENIALAEEFATKMANDLGVIADCCIHNPKLKSDAPAPKPKSNAADKVTDDDDERNIHAHIMFTTRKVELDATNQLIFTDKADSELYGTARKLKGLAKERDYIKAIRAEWAEMVNKRLSEHGIKAVSSLSYRERKLNILPQVHIGRDPLSDSKREHNDEISERNESVFNSRVATLKGLASSAYGQPATTDKYIERANRTIANDKRVTGHLDKGIKYSQQRIEYSERLIEDGVKETPNPFTDALRRSRAARESAADSYDREAAAFDRASNETARELQKYSGLGDKWVGQRKYVVAQYARNAEILNRKLIQKILERNDSKNRIRWESYESADDPTHSKKFDKRQQELLEAFATEHNLDRRSHEDHYDLNQRLKELANNSDFFKDNANIFEIVRNAENEREKHNAIRLSDSRQGVPIINSQNSSNKQDKDLDKAKNELRIDNNTLKPRF